MTLAIDIGNTYTKIGVFNKGQIIHTRQYQHTNASIIDNILKGFAIKNAIICSVKHQDVEWEQMLGPKIPLYYFTTAMATGIAIHYLTPKTLGHDRLASVTGARHLYPGQNSLVISGGTCITYDYVDADGNYFGGSISPGLNMRYNALNYYTAGLPLINTDEHFTAAYGSDTKSAITSGVQNGIKYELTGFIESYEKAGQQLNIILSGGDSIFFDTLLKNSIFARYIKIEPYLVLKGLNAAINNNND
jgi:type III pantothenate kinase